MKIILNEDVYNLGEEGDVCDVARGYARNYLFPKGFAVPYTKENIAVFESRRAAIEKRKEEKRKAAQSLRERLEGMEIVLPMNAGESGKLFGSVTSAMIVEQLDKEGIELEKKQVEVPSNSIKMTGTYKIMVKLYESESAEITVKVINQNRPEGGESASREAQAGEASAETAVSSESAASSESAGEVAEKTVEAAEPGEAAETAEAAAEPGEAAETAEAAEEEAGEAAEAAVSEDATEAEESAEESVEEEAQAEDDTEEERVE